MRLHLLSLLFVIACNGGDTDDSDTDTDVGPVCLAENDADGDGYCPPEDCDDTNLNVYPGAAEIPYNNRDDDCDGQDIMDADGDGFNGGPDGDDCMDSNPNVYPGADEPCYPDLDYNCDGIISPDDCDLDGWVRNEDCDDEDDSVYPGAPDTFYDGVDSDCNYKSDFDADGDGDDMEWQEDWPLESWPDFIAAWDPLEPGKLAYIRKEDAEASWYDHGQDCNDGDPLVGGRLDELWDGIDRNCDNTIDALNQNDAWKTWNGNSGAGGAGGMLAGDGAFTTAIANLGDIDGDGFPEIAFSDLKAAEYAGRVYVISTNATAGKAYQAARSSIEDKDLAANFTGWDIATAGDLNGDGKNELLVGSPLLGGDGGVLVFDGDDLFNGPDLNLTDALAFVQSGLYAGMYTNTLDDLTGDSVPEIISAGGYYGAFNVSIYDGADIGDGGTFASGDAEAILSNSSRIGGDVIGTTDFDGDGAVDVLMASVDVTLTETGPDCSSGTAQFYWGTQDDLTGGVIVKTGDLPTLTGSSCAGITMGAINDINGDGYAELMIADPSVQGKDTFDNGGAVYIINGSDLSDGAVIETSATWTIESESGGSWLRVSDTSADHDGDGKPDVFVGAPGLFHMYEASQGIVAPSSANNLYWFRASTLGTGGTFSTADAEADFFHFTDGSGLGGSWAVGPMDDSDNIADLVIGAPSQGVGGAFVFLSNF